MQLEIGARQRVRGGRIDSRRSERRVRARNGGALPRGRVLKVVREEHRQVAHGKVQAAFAQSLQ
jgi:hypothetical protein